MLGARPRHAPHQPAPGDNSSNELVSGVRRGGEANQPVLEAERTLGRVVAAGQGEDPVVGGDGEARAVGARRAALRARDDREAIGRPSAATSALTSGMSSTADCECGRMTKLPALRRRSISPAPASRVSALLTVMREQPYCAVSSCSNGNPPPRRPFARQNARLDVGQDAPMQRAAAVGARGARRGHRTSRRTAAA